MKSDTEAARKRTTRGSARNSEAQTSSIDGSSTQEPPREQMIAEAAYYRAEQRDFAPGHEMADWLLAEADVEKALGTLH